MFACFGSTGVCTATYVLDKRAPLHVNIYSLQIYI